MIPAQATQPLPPRYYLRNFERLRATVEDQYGDLLSEQERGCLQRFDAASVDARCLFVRLASRRGPLFRSQDLEYRELDDLSAALEENLELGLLVEPAPPDVDALLAVLRKKELAEVAAFLVPVSGRERKSELVEKLLELPDDQVAAAWQRWRPSRHRLVEVAWRREIELFQILFFGNSYQTLTEFVLSDLGIANYHDYALDRSHRLFYCREEVDDYLALRELKSRFKEAVAEGEAQCVSEIGDTLLEAGSGGLLAASYRDELRNRVARQLERYALCDQAVALYGVSNLHPARERRTRLLAAAGDTTAALSLCEAIEAAPCCEAEVDFARRQLPTLRRRLNRDYQPLRRDRFEEDQLRLPRELPVEMAAARHYAQQWAEVHFVENLLINGSFGLAFWEQIFEPAPGAFINPFQAAPMDMFSPGFYRSRKASIDRRLAELETGALAGELLAAHARYRGINNRWVGWRGLSRELLAAALQRIPSAHWLACWRRLLFDPEANRAGCPDLIALDESRGYCLIEVKGPGDQLQLNQRRWLRFFQRVGIPAKVARVGWADD